MARTISMIAAELADGPADVETLWKKWCEWPPDAFAFLSLILVESDLYRLVVSPPGAGLHWPIDEHWLTRVRSTADQWLNLVDERSPDTAALAAWRQLVLEVLLRWADRPLRDFVGAVIAEDEWKSICRLLEAHATADEACVGLGIPGGTPFTFYALVANKLLYEQGSLARHPANTVRVLPKLRTSQVGLTLRSLSHHVGCTTECIGVRWRVFPGSFDFGEDQRLSLLLIPWPMSMSDRFVVPTRGPLENLERSQFGFFKLEPTYTFDEDFFLRLAEEARSRARGVLGVVLPEAALTPEEAVKLERIMRDTGVDLVLTGVRNGRRNVARLSIPSESKAYEQPKHHRWCLDGPQIEQYGQEWSLNPSRRWWEDIEILGREVHFVCASEWLSICHLICEDLARLEPVSPVVRAVGPNLLIALLQDGPQLERRWPGRYASVFSDDPGASVLTLTSLGMVQASSRGPHPPSRTIALWKDPVSGVRELELPEDSHALIITLCPEYAREWTADGRSDGGAAARLRLVGAVGI